MPDGRVVMSWIEPHGDSGLALRCATFDGKRWTAPATVAAGDSFFANWADFPSVCALGGRRLAAHWLWKSSSGVYAYDVRVSQSDDAGRTWGPMITPHHDGTPTEHGFVSLVPDRQGVRAIWLDGRKSVGYDEGSPGPAPDMALRSALITHEGALEDEGELDGRTCDCCQTAAVQTARGILVAYRDRSPDEIRDIYLTRFEKQRWSAPYRLHADGWHIAGCPVNGPALDSRGEHVGVAWYTAASDTPRVKVAFSGDGGTTFDPPIGLDDGAPIGRVHLSLFNDGSALVIWLESHGKDALLRARRAWPSGRVEDAFTVVRTAAARSSGFPRLARSRDSVVFAWTEIGPVSRVRVALLPMQ